MTNKRFKVERAPTLRNLLLSVATAGCFLPLLAFSQEQPATKEASQWDYDKYHNAYPEEVCRLVTSQTGHTNLQPAWEFCRDGERKATNNEKLRERIRLAWRELLGPSSRNTGPLNAKILEEQEFPDYIRRKVEYEADPHEPVRAWLFLPKSGRAKKGPAMLCLHQTAREGKDQAAGFDPNNPQLAFGPLLAKRGYVTLCPDAICFGERYQVAGSFYCHYGDAVRLYRVNPGRSIMSKMADDAMRAVDYLAALPQVDRKRIGSIGHSHGGYGTLFAMAFDERIKAGVVSCGFTCFRPDPLPDRWYRRTALIPRLGGYEGRMEDTPIDFHHLFAAIAPRGLFLSVALKDSIFPNVGDVQWINQDLKSVYQREHMADNFELYSFEGGHGFTPEARDRAWTFLDKRLKNQSKGK